MTFIDADGNTVSYEAPMLDERGRRQIESGRYLPLHPVPEEQAS
jgi:hypothetical protein